MAEYISNPFETILEKLNELDKRLVEKSKIIPPEIIDRVELRKRLKITEPTAIRWEKKGHIPSFRIGSSVRYNWPTVVAALEK